MNFNDVITRHTRKNKILFHKNNDCLMQLQAKLQTCNKRVIVLWALDCAKKACKDFNVLYPNETRAKMSIDLCEKWAFNSIKMKQAKRAILDLHAAVKENDDIVFQSYCHAIAQAGSCVHTSKHALGLPMYELSALVFKQKDHDFREEVTKKIEFYENQIDYWKTNELFEDRSWAMFMKEKEIKCHE